MRKINIIFCIIAVLFFGTYFNVSAATDDVAPVEPTHFSVDTTLSGSSVNNKNRNFTVQVAPHDPRIYAWKVRFFCDGKFTVNMPLQTTDMCGRAVDMTSAQIQNFQFATFKHSRGRELEPFAFKIKAYDVQGKWLHTEEKIFRMR